MQFIDWVILLACASAAIGGYWLGFVARAASWVGMAIGFLIALQILPPVLRNAHGLSSMGRLGVVVLLMLIGVLLGQMLGLLVGSRLSASLPPGVMRKSDRIAGSAAGVFGVLFSVWLMLPTAANVPGWTAQQVRSSDIAQAIYNKTPKPPNAMETLRRLVGSSGFPSVFDGIAPAPDTGPAPESIDMAADVLERVRMSTVKVEGVACRRTQEGSGFAVGPNLIATNAHVVAGENKTEVLLPTGQRMSATVVAYDPARDLALLRVPRYTQQALPLGSSKIGQTGAVFGHPGGQDPVAISPAAVRQEIVAIGRDLYDRQQTRRNVLVLASQLRQGDSGGALVDQHGTVIGVAFAIAPDKPGTAYALNTSELRAVLDKPHDQQVSTGACVTE